jgi:hypothetical protein
MNAKKAADAALKQAISKANAVLDDLLFIKRHREKHGETMPDIRRNLAALAQRVHEFNAYTNFIPKP